jgi:hypothetical protein
MSITVKSEVEAYPSTDFKISIVVNPPAPCVLKFASNFLAGDIKYYKRPHSLNMPSDFVDYQSTIKIDLPQVSSTCENQPFIFSIDSQGIDITSLKCATMQPDLKAVLISTKCIDGLSAGLAEVNVGVRHESSQPIGDVFQARLEIVEHSYKQAETDAPSQAATDAPSSTPAFVPTFATQTEVPAEA